MRAHCTGGSNRTQEALVRQQQAAFTLLGTVRVAANLVIRLIPCLYFHRDFFSPWGHFASFSQCSSSDLDPFKCVLLLIACLHSSIDKHTQQVVLIYISGFGTRHPSWGWGFYIVSQRHSAEDCGHGHARCSQPHGCIQQWTEVKGANIPQQFRNLVSLGELVTRAWG
jgi:hypothetical protein